MAKIKLWCDVTLWPFTYPAALVFAFAAVIPFMPGHDLDSGFAAAVFPPWWTAPSAMGAASEAGTLAGVGFLPFMVFITPDRTDYSAKLHQAGAWLVLDPGIVKPCGHKSEGRGI